MDDGIHEALLADLLGRLAARSLADGAIAALPGDAEPSVDATVWRALALRLAGAPHAAAARAAGAAVARAQGPDGRVSLSPSHPGAWSPTAVAILAWSGREEFATTRALALEFLLAEEGDHFPRGAGSALGIDTDLVGWPWIERTFSWAEPTALAVLALAAAGESEHPRARAGRALLLDRQIASGGWNYGNSQVFGADLRPAQESTGLVLAALAGAVPATQVRASLAYLESALPSLRSPLSLGWALLATAAWRLPSATDPAPAVRETLEREKRYGAYDSAELALLAVALCAPRGLLAALAETT